MDGFYGQMLTIDLSLQTAAITKLPDELLAATLGGKGLTTHLLLMLNPTGVDPLSPENRLIVATGPFCQSRIWGGSRYGVFTKSPLTHRYAESYSGGRVPEAIDAAGFDAVVVVGRAKAPTVVSVHPGGADFFDAGDLWGLDCYAAEKTAVERFNMSKEGFGKPGAMVIGPAGERGVRFAMIANDRWRCAGRTGAGAVMGAKNLKAMVFQGDQRRSLHRPDAVADYAKAFSKAHMHAPGVEAYRGMGTTMMVALMNTVGAFPTRYWEDGTCAHWEKISGETYHREHEVKPHACAKCFMACGRMARIAKGRHQGLTIEGPEYETIYAFGGLCMVEDMAEIAYLNDLCDRHGIDTITAGNLCALAIEAVRRGRIDFNIDYGEAEKIATLIEAIAEREGIGDLLAEGIKAAAAHWGLEEIAVHVKGLEPAGYDPRVLKGMGLTFATSPRGACHLRTTFYKPELAGLIPPDTIDGKAEMLVDYEDRLNLFDTLILCRFYRDLYTWEELEKLLPLVTGLPSDKHLLRQKAAAIATMTRHFNIREGLTHEEDRLPRRLLENPLPSGKAISEAEMARLLADYYRHRGWDEYGIPATPGS